MKLAVFIIFGVLSMAVGVFFICHAIRLFKEGRRARKVLTPIHIATMGVFIAVALMFLPVYYTGYDFGDSCTLFRPLLLSLHNTLRVFILDGDFETVTKGLAGEHIALRVHYGLYAAILYVAAPVLTFGNVLSLFRNVWGEVRYFCSRKKSYYIMSELNAKSIALAESIRRKKPGAVIVFTDVFEQNEERDSDLLTQANEMKAICLKRDIVHLGIADKIGDVEMFFIGDDESENVSQAIRITNELDRLEKKNNVKLFVFSRSAGSAYILDSVRYDNLLKHSKSKGYDQTCFKLRRVDEIRQLVWKTVPQMNVYELANKHGGTFHILIAGMGAYGMEFFRMLLWYCQFEGYKLNITVVDKQTDGPDGKRSVRSRIQRLFPELMDVNKSQIVGESKYDVEILPGIDMQTADFDQLLLYSGEDPEKNRLAQRLRQTNLAIVALGEDEANIEVAVHLRTLFDRVNGIKAKGGIKLEDEAVQIYSVVYDDQKSGNLHCDDTTEFRSNYLMNYKAVPYHIHFIGRMSVQFSYDYIYDAALEEEARKKHEEWVEIEEKIHDELLKQGGSNAVKGVCWSYSGQKTPEAVLDMHSQYDRFEYYRLSSIAKQLYQYEVEKVASLRDRSVCLQGGDLQTCQCDNCVRRKKSEHMRWNAYVRGLGISHGTEKAERACLHNNLCGWEGLTPIDRLKD